tara:strand:- start:90 stop:425 length:336 start_codon:yes stop_codon:yes gene_type:complete
MEVHGNNPQNGEYPDLPINTMRTRSSSTSIIRNSWSYPALREWAKHLKTSDDAIDRMIIRARKEKAPLYAVEQQSNGEWQTLSHNTPKNIEAFFKAHNPRMLQSARQKQST